MMKTTRLLFVLLLVSSCNQPKKQDSKEVSKPAPETIIQEEVTFKYDSVYVADSFDYPVGKPNATGYYNAQKFGENFHLGDDWNAVTGGNTDLGDPIYAVANGYVKFAQDHGSGWGNVIRIIHQLPDGKMVESLYAHCDTILVKEKDWVKKGTKIGTIGTANGIYLAHLHFEIRDDIELPIGAGYAENQDGYIDPTKFITEHR